MQAISGDARPTPSVALYTLPNLPLPLKSKMVAIAFARPKNAPALQAKIDSVVCHKESLLV